MKEPSKTSPQIARDAHGRLKKGVILNPLGRGAAGSKTADQLADEALLRASGPLILAEAIRRGLKSSDALLVKLVDRLIPPATRVLDLSTLPDVTLPSSATTAALACLGLLKSGEVTTGEMSALLGVYKSLGESLAELKHQKFAESIEEVFA